VSSLLPSLGPTALTSFAVLAEYFQHRNVEELYLNDPSWYAEQQPDRFAFHVGEQVTGIDAQNKTVRTSKGNVFK
jgi:nitrite reductase (NAD(P)H)